MKTKRKGLYVLLTPEDEKLIKVLKGKGALNISQLVRNAIRKEFERCEQSDEQ